MQKIDYQCSVEQQHVFVTSVLLVIKGRRQRLIHVADVFPFQTSASTVNIIYI